MEWYANNPLSKWAFEEALWQWKNDFPIHDSTLEKIAKLEALGDRTSKKGARDKRREAFKVHVRDTCPHY